MDDNDVKIFSYIESKMPHYDVDLMNLYFSLPIKQEFSQDVIEAHDNYKKYGYRDYQERISRLMDVSVPFKNQLLFYQQGTGKTLIYLTIIERYRKKNLLKNPPIIIVRNDILMRTLFSQIEGKLSENFEYSIFGGIDAYNELKREKGDRGVNNIIKKYYRFYTYDGFAKALQDDPDGQHKISNDTIIVLDEVQHCKDNKAIKIHTTIRDFFKKLVNTKIFLCSGTPMIDSYKEFLNVLDLLLTNDEKLPTIEFDKSGNLTESSIKEIDRAILGKISYILYTDKNAYIDIKKYAMLKDENGKDSGIFYTPIPMSKEQSDVYAKSIYLDLGSKPSSLTTLQTRFVGRGKPELKKEESDEESENEEENSSSVPTASTYSKTIHASMFMFPNGDIGKSGENKYLNVRHTSKDEKDLLEYMGKNLSVIATEIHNGTLYVVNYKKDDQYILLFEKYLHIHKIVFDKFKTNTVDSSMDMDSYSIKIKENNINVIIVVGAIKNIESHNFFRDMMKDFSPANKDRTLKSLGITNRITNIKVIEINPIVRDTGLTGILKSKCDKGPAYINKSKFLEYVKIHSAKYHFILNNILEVTKLPKIYEAPHKLSNIPNIDKLPFVSDNKFFVYTRKIYGSGIVVFKCLLEYLGYTNAMDENTETVKGKFGKMHVQFTDKKPKPRYMFIDSKTPKELYSKFLKIYNSYDNVDGRFIQIFIGTETVSEGISLSDTPVMFSVNQSWNMSSIEQAERRIMRMNSFTNYIKKKNSNRRDGDKIEKIEIQIHRLVAVPTLDGISIDSGTGSIDKYMLELALKKDKQIKQIERRCKIMAIDCMFNKSMNEYSDSYKNTRECEYTDCKYKCVGELRSTMPHNEAPLSLIYDTFDTFYPESSIEDCKNDILNYFEKRIICAYDVLVKMFMDKYRSNVINEALYNIINNKELIKNNILKYDSGMLYISNYFMDNNVYNYNYVTIPLVRGFNQSLSEYVNTLSESIIGYEDILNSNDVDKLYEFLYSKYIDIDTVVDMLKYSITIKPKNACSNEMLNMYRYIFNDDISNNIGKILFEVSPYSIYIDDTLTSVTKIDTDLKYSLSKSMYSYYRTKFEYIIQFYEERNSDWVIFFRAKYHKKEHKKVTYEEFKNQTELDETRTLIDISGIQVLVVFIPMTELKAILQKTIIPGEESDDDQEITELENTINLYLGIAEATQYIRKQIFKWKGWGFDTFKQKFKRFKNMGNTIETFTGGIDIEKNEYEFIKYAIENDLIVYY